MKIQTWRGAALAALLLATTGSWALDDSSRSLTWQTTFRLTDIEGNTYATSNGSSAETDNTIGYAFGFDYNFNENFALGGSFSWSNMDYDAKIVPASGNSSSPISLSGTMETNTIAINGTYNFLNKVVTPFVTGSMGATYIDTNVPNGPPVPVCWYDPWYGYYCGSVVPTKDETDFSYGVGAGVRWDVTELFFMRGVVNKNWIQASGDIGTPGFLSYGLDLGLRF